LSITSIFYIIYCSPHINHATTHSGWNHQH
jgi:hypothetical protein